MLSLQPAPLNYRKKGDGRVAETRGLSLRERGFNCKIKKSASMVRQNHVKFIICIIYIPHH